MIYIISRCWCNKFTLTATNISKWSWKLHLEFLVYISDSDRKQRSMNSSLVKTWKQFWNSLFSLTPHVFFFSLLPVHVIISMRTILQRGEICRVASGYFCFLQISAERCKFILLWPYNGWLSIGSLSIHKLEFEVNWIRIKLKIHGNISETTTTKKVLSQKFVKFIYLIFRFFLFFFFSNTLFR